MQELGKFLVMAGIGIMIAGALIWMGWGKWIGKLPGDISIQKGNFGFYFPVVTCLVISAVLTLLAWAFRK